MNADTCGLPVSTAYLEFIFLDMSFLKCYSVQAWVKIWSCWKVSQVIQWTFLASSTRLHYNAIKRKKRRGNIRFKEENNSFTSKCWEVLRQVHLQPLSKDCRSQVSFTVETEGGWMLRSIETITYRHLTGRKSLFLGRHGYICAIQQGLPCRLWKRLLLLKNRFKL